MFHDYTKSGNACSFCSKIYVSLNDMIHDGVILGIVKTSDRVAIVQSERLTNTRNVKQAKIVMGIRFCPCCGRNIS